MARPKQSRRLPYVSLVHIAGQKEECRRENVGNGVEQLADCRGNRQGRVRASVGLRLALGAQSEAARTCARAQDFALPQAIGNLSAQQGCNKLGQVRKAGGKAALEGRGGG